MLDEMTCMLVFLIERVSEKGFPKCTLDRVNRAIETA